MKRRSKIVCTLGPAVDSEHQIRGLIEAGMNVARINCSHGGWEQRLQWIQWVRKNSPRVAPVAVLVDLQGPKFRLGNFAGGTLDLQSGDKIFIGADSSADLPILQPEILRSLCKGARVLLGDGDVELKILAAREDGCFEGVAISGGVIRSRQGVTVVGKSFDCETLTEQDTSDAEEACRAGADYIALSYVHRASDMTALREIVNRHNSYVALCAKIETKAALGNIEELIDSSDAVMVARGDLGLQMPIEEVPLAQKHIIARSRQKGKPVITATQMLESMMHSPRPTRAEVTDVANAILDGTDAVMLSGETASGQFPLEAVRYMSRIAERAETMLPKTEISLMPKTDRFGRMDHTEAVAHGVAQLADFLNPRAIVTSTTSGRTAILVSKFRPKSPILCAAWNRKVQAQLGLVWGVEAAHVELPRTSDEQIANAVSVFVAEKRLKADDQVIVSAGVPPGIAGNTNMILVLNVKP